LTRNSNTDGNLGF